MGLHTISILISSFLIGSVVHSAIVLQDNGYTGILVAISEDVEQPIDDGGLELINSLEVLLSIDIFTNRLYYIITKCITLIRPF